ncbi:phosphodiester glycosidase family protein [Oceanispirochaeta sp. M1]|nr:phosphodiester glycosidase family protein [Oceanispirochaeta sp. M1]
MFGLMKYHKSRVHLFLISVLTVLLLSCTSTSPVLEKGVSLLPPLTDPVWIGSGTPGMKVLAEMDQNNPVGGAALALDTSLLEFVISTPDPTGKGETRSAKTSEFALQADVHIALNASPFSAVDVLNRSNRPMDIVGVQINDGRTVSQPEPSYDALYVLKDGQILLGSQRSVPEGTWTALGGFHLLLEEDVNLGGNDIRHPRTAVGLSEDGKTFYLAVFDGRQTERAGLTTEETACWMSWLGCSTALNMDGGGSSAIVIKKNGTVRILNSPIHRGKPGLERAVANHLGILIRTP